MTTAAAKRIRPDLAARNRERATHGLSRTTTYNIWRTMLARCTRPTSKDYARYGARGITVCDRWKSFENFVADMGICPDGMSLDRIENDKGYAPDNCRWATPSEQSRNRRSNKVIEWNGQAKPLAEWAELLGIDRKALQMRLKSWSVEQAFTTPYQPRKGK